MRNAILSIAALASGVLAAPSWEGQGGNWGDDGAWTKRPMGNGWGSWSESWSSAESTLASTSSIASATASETSSAVHSVTSSASPTFSFSANSTSSLGPTGSAHVKPTTNAHSTTYTTEVVTLYTTVCPATKTHITSGSTFTSTFMTTSTLTSSYTTTVMSQITSPVASSSSAVVKPTTMAESTTYTTEVETIYTTVCPATETHTTSGSTVTSTFMTTSTLTSSYTATIISQVTSPVASSTSPAKTTVYDVTTIYTTICPATTTSVSGSETLTKTYLTTSTLTAVNGGPATSGIAVTPVGPGAPSNTKHESVTVTDVTTVYTTICPVTTTITSGQSTMISTYHETSTVTSVGKSTITLTATATPSKSMHESVTVTDVTTVYTTVCPVTTTMTSGHSTTTSTYDTTSTVTTVYQSTITLTATETATVIGYSTVQWGTAVYSYAITDSITFPTSTATTFVGPDSYTKASSTSMGSDNSSNASTTSAGSDSSSKASSSMSGKPTGSGNTIKPSGSVSTKKTAGPSGSVIPSSKPGMATGSVTSKPVRPSGTASTTSSVSAKPSESCVPCEGQPGKDPLKWCGYTINDNSYKVMPKTCRTVEYDFYVTNTTIAPDGVSRLGLLVNGQMPGPKIEANWGDTIVVRLHNQMQDNGTAIHFHGQRQNYTNEMDGVPSITQCPLAPGQTQTYTFKAGNYGTSWWHSHYALQIYSGVFGPMIVHGPSSAEYDVEEFVTIQDWNHIPLEELYDASQEISNPKSGPQTLDTGLMNGKNVFSTAGSRYTLNVESGKTYRLRLLNSAVQTSFKFYLDGHKFQVIANDYVPIKPYTTTIVNIHPGQRYDVIFKADQPVGNYWLRADGQQTCTQLKNSKDIKGIVSYKGAASGTPTSTAYTYTEECVEEPLASLVPVHTISAGSQEQNLHETVLIGGNGGTPNLYKWTLSGTTFQSQYGDPSLVSIYNNGSIPNYSGNLAIEVPKLGEWVYVIIESPIPVPHPIHLHGHDFLVLAQGYGPYLSTTPLNTASPARRDSALLPGNRGQGGYLVVAFIADNPGAWLMHCHIGWHSAMGFALQIIENLEGIAETVKYGDELNRVCSSWSEYATETGLVVIDAGI